jgi:hypothetical protein
LLKTTLHRQRFFEVSVLLHAPAIDPRSPDQQSFNIDTFAWGIRRKMAC